MMVINNLCKESDQEPIRQTLVTVCIIILDVVKLTYHHFDWY